MATPSVSQAKRALRKKMTTILKSVSEEQQANQSKAICERLKAHPLVQGSHDIAAYIPFPGELDITDLLRHLFGRSRVFVPFMNDPSAGKMTFVRLFSEQDLEENFTANKWGILEPTPKALEDAGREDLLRDRHSIDLMITPGLGFDPYCRRIGRGKGFYDRFFENYAALHGLELDCTCLDSVRRRMAPFPTIAVGYDEQMIKEDVPTESHDVLLHETLSATTTARNSLVE